MSTEENTPDANSLHVSDAEKEDFKAVQRQMQVDLDRDLSQPETVKFLCQLYSQLENPAELIEA